MRESLANIDPTDMESGLIKGVVKESLRLYPIAHVIGRLLDSDCIIEGYGIPVNVSHTSSLN